MKRQHLLIFVLCVSGVLVGTTRDAYASCPSLSLECFYLRNLGVMRLSTAFAQDEPVVLSNVAGAATLVIEEGPIVGSGAGVKPLTLPAFSAGFVIKEWEDSSLALEMILAPPNMVKIEMIAKGTLAHESLAPYALGNIPTGVEPAGEELGTVEALPPMLTAVYRPWKDAFFRPYGGAGLAYMLITGGDITNELMTSVEGAKPRLQPKNNFGNLGLVLQGGVEVRLAKWKNKNFYLTFDTKLIAFLTVEAKVVDIYVEAPGLPVFGPVKVGDASAAVTVNPLIFQFGAGMDF